MAQLHRRRVHRGRMKRALAWTLIIGFLILFCIAFGWSKLAAFIGFIVVVSVPSFAFTWLVEHGFFKDRK